METTTVHIESFEQACQKKGYDHASVLPDVSKFPVKHQKALLAMAMLVIICEAENDGHEFDWNNWDERKWYPWFDMEKTDENPTGFRFDVSVCSCTFAVLSGGSRLCLRTREASDHIGKAFLPLFRDIMVIEK